MPKQPIKPLGGGFDNIFNDAFQGAAPGQAVSSAARSHDQGDVDFLLDLVFRLKGQGDDADDAASRAHSAGNHVDAEQVTDLGLEDAAARGGKSTTGSGGGGGGGKGGKPDKTVSDPGTTDPGTTDPGTTDPGTTDPGTTDPTPTKVYYQGADYVSGLDTPDGFNIEIVFAGTGWTSGLMDVLKQTTEMLSDVIIGDLSDTTVNGILIDDLRINATLSTMDGVGGKIGSGGMEAYRSGSYLTSVGRMSFDTDDAANLLSKGLWDDVVAHEILHSLGFGITWNALGLVSDVGGDLRFNGEMATHFYKTDFAAIASVDNNADYGVPIETDGGSGTAGSHWDETTFKNELMTGWLSNNAPMSNMTLAALDDMGYMTVLHDDFLIV